MNINDFWEPYPTLVDPLKGETWKEILRMRRATFYGFLAVEQTNGFLGMTHIHTSQGQEMLRIIFFRVLEELSEAMMSEDSAHRKEEMIDAFNYLISSVLIDKEADPSRLDLWLSIQLLAGWKRAVFDESDLDHVMLGMMTLNICGKLADTFRNRAWMHHAQDPYFNGMPMIAEVIQDVTEVVFNTFSSFSEFLAYYYAKDRVLQFRLKSNY